MRLESNMEVKVGEYRGIDLYMRSVYDVGYPWNTPEIIMDMNNVSGNQTYEEVMEENNKMRVNDTYNIALKKGTLKEEVDIIDGKREYIIDEDTNVTETYNDAGLPLITDSDTHRAEYKWDGNNNLIMIKVLNKEDDKILIIEYEYLDNEINKYSSYQHVYLSTDNKDHDMHIKFDDDGNVLEYKSPKGATLYEYHDNGTTHIYVYNKVHNFGEEESDRLEDAIYTDLPVSYMAINKNGFVYEIENNIFHRTMEYDENDNTISYRDMKPRGVHIDIGNGDDIDPDIVFREVMSLGELDDGFIQKVMTRVGNEEIHNTHYANSDGIIYKTDQKTITTETNTIEYFGEVVDGDKRESISHIVRDGIRYDIERRDSGDVLISTDDNERLYTPDTHDDNEYRCISSTDKESDIQLKIDRIFEEVMDQDEEY